MGRAIDGEATTSVETSVAMLREVLDGATYVRVGQNHGVSRTAVERRIKTLARWLSHTIGIPGLNDGGVSFVTRLRVHRAAVLQALETFDVHSLSQRRRDRPIRAYTTEEVVEAAGRIRAYSSQPARDVAMFLLLFATGAWPLEVARLQVRDFLREDGEVRGASELRAEAAVNGFARPLYFKSTRLNAALSRYLGERLNGVEPPEGTAYRGLDPDQALFLAADGQGFAIATYPHGDQCRYLCRPILETYRKIFRYAALPGTASARAVRTTVAARLYARGAQDKQIGLLLGIAQRSSVRQLFPRPQPTMAELAEELL